MTNIIVMFTEILMHQNQEPIGGITFVGLMKGGLTAIIIALKTGQDDGLTKYI